MIRRLAIALIVLVVVAMPDAIWASPSHRNQTSATSISPALSRLAACVTGNKQLAIVMLMDESGSLRKTDPQNSRVAAAKAAVDGLAGLVRRGDGDVRVDVQIAGFGVDFESNAPWLTIAADGGGGVQERIDSFATRNGALDTDYANALDGAIGSARSRAQTLTSADGNPPCTAVLWFTDGEYSVEDRTTPGRKQSGVDNRGESQTKEYAPDVDLYRPGGGAATVERGKEVLCNPGGIADQYRATETSLFAVALTSQIAPEDLTFLRTVAAGGGCGERDGTANGDLLAGDLSELVGFFDEIVTGLGNPASAETTDLQACPIEQTSCPQGTKTFEVDGSLRRFHVLAQVDAPGIAVRLTGPGAPPVDIPVSGTAPPVVPVQAGATPVSWAWLSANALTIDAESTSGGANWGGTWSVTFIDTTGTHPSAPVRARIYLFGDVVPQLERGTEFRSGELNEFAVKLARVEGTPITDDSLPTQISVSATVTDPSTGDTVDLGPLTRVDGSWMGTYDVPESLSAATVNLSIRADVTTDTGIALAPSIATAPVVILPPVGFPTVTTRHLTVGPIVGTDPGTTKIAIVGSDKSDTCVWLDQLNLDNGPIGPGKIKAYVDGDGATDDRCLRVPEGETAELVVEFAPSEPQRGVATGSLVLATRSVNTDDVRPISIDLDAQLVKPASAEVAWAIFAALFLLGIGMPVLAFYFSNWIIGKFAPLRLLQGCSVPMELSDSGVRRVEPRADGRLLTPDDFDARGFSSGSGTNERLRHFEFGGVEFEAAVSSNPFRPPFGRADLVGDKSRQVLGSARGTSHGKSGRIPLWITREWVFIPDAVNDSEAPATGNLVAFVLATDRNVAVDSLENKLADRLPALAEMALRTRTVTEPPKEPVAAGIPTADVWGDGQTDASVSTTAMPAGPDTRAGSPRKPTAGHAPTADGEFGSSSAPFDPPPKGRDKPSQSPTPRPDQNIWDD